MLSRTEIESLARRKPAAQSPTLSLYLDVDQGKATNLNRKFESAAKDMLRSAQGRLDESEKENFVHDAARAVEHVSRLEPSAKGVILFTDVSENFFWSHEVRVPVHNIARWSETPYVKPLLALMDDHERYGVVLADKQRGRLFTVFMGEIEEHQDFLVPLPVRRIKSPGMDHIRSERGLQNKAASDVHLHLKHVAESLDKLVHQYRFDRILIGGPVEATSELQHLLPKRVRGRLVERISLPLTASTDRVLEETLRVGERIERQMEEHIVDELMAGEDHHHPFTLGLDRTVRALCEERIWRMVYADGFTHEGGLCSGCTMLSAKPNGACEYCGAAITPADDLLDRMVQRAIEQDSLLEEVRGSAAARLREAGGIGAILRF